MTYNEEDICLIQKTSAYMPGLIIGNLCIVNERHIGKR